MANKTAKRKLNYHLNRLRIKDGDIVIQKICPNDERVTDKAIYRMHRALQKLLRSTNNNVEVVTVSVDTEFESLTLEQLINLRERFNEIIESRN